MIFSSRTARFWSIASVDIAALVLLAPDWGGLGRDLRAPGSWVTRAGADGAAAALAGAALWLCAAWVCLGLAAVVLTAIPGRVGATGRWFARHLLPAAALRLVATATGLSILVVPVAVAQARISAAAGPGPTTSATAPSWPADGPGLPLLTLGWPVQAAATPAPGPPTAGHTAPTRVVVAPGDCLWTIAESHLDPAAPPDRGRTAAAVTRWYAANRAIIGPDPGLLRPGQVLTAPELLR